LGQEKEKQAKKEHRAGFRVAKKRTGIRMGIRVRITIAYIGRASRFRCGT
jgi:hypothetical protein